MSRSPSIPHSLKSIKDAFAQTASMYDLRVRDVERIFYATIEAFFRTNDYWIDGDGLKIRSHFPANRVLSPTIYEEMKKNNRDVPPKVVAFLRKIRSLKAQDQVYSEYLDGGFEHAKRFVAMNGIDIDGKAQEHIGYKNLTKKEFAAFYKLYMSNIKKERIDEIRQYVDGVLEANGNILYCEKIKYSPGENLYHLRPLLSKDVYLDSLVVIVKPLKNRDGEQIMFPDRLKRIPVYIKNPKRNRNALSDRHALKASGDIMNMDVANFHLSILNRRLLKQHDIDLELRAVKVNARGTRIQYDSAYTLPVDVIKVIGNYFRSFNAHAYIINR